MNRTYILDAAKHCITVDRQKTHGDAENSFGLIAGYWSSHLDTHVTSADVAVMMVLFKLARIKGNPLHADSYVDAVGYAALSGEIGTQEI